MLILPLHQPMTRANFPLVTVALIAINVLVYLLLQSGDSAAETAASEYYQSSGLSVIEAPLFQRHLEQYPDASLDAVLQQVPSDLQPMVLDQWQQSDARFRERLRRGELFQTDEQKADWLKLQPRLELLLSRVFTDRHALHADRPALATLFSSMFLHGGVDHLIGNMLLLLALGLLVEGALGAALFGTLYLFGGLGAGLSWAALNQHGSLIGASGAIASLMGAFCILWGRRKVRYFYWFFVFFNYVRGPALALLPIWLGWELLQFLTRDGSSVAYEAHAGGIVVGALLALLISRLRWQREAFFELVPASDAQHDDQLTQAKALLGQLKLAEAEQLLQAVDKEQPGRFEVALAHFRCALLQKRPGVATELAERIVLSTMVGSDIAQKWKVYQDLLNAGGDLSAATKLNLAAQLLTLGRSSESLELAKAALSTDQAVADLAQSLLSLAVRMNEAGDREAAKTLLGQLCHRAPQSAQASKAEFLLKEW